jgi:hypothetical protein
LTFRTLPVETGLAPSQTNPRLYSSRVDAEKNVPDVPPGRFSFMRRLIDKVSSLPEISPFRSD